MINKMEIIIDLNYQMLSQVIYHYNHEVGLNSTKVIIDYKGITKSPYFSSSEFNERQYIQKSNGNYIPTNTYSGYEIMVITQEDLND